MTKEEFEEKYGKEGIYHKLSDYWIVLILATLFTKSKLDSLDSVHWTLILSTTLFVVLKMTSVISWSWLWIFSPIWIPLALLFLAAIIVQILFYSVSKNINTAAREEDEAMRD